MADVKATEKPLADNETPIPNGRPPADASAPPAYDGLHMQGLSAQSNAQPEDLSARLDDLNLSVDENRPTPDRCIAHLKLLEALHQLRDTIASTDGLFGIVTPPEKKSEKQSEQKANADAQVAVREKRWAVYVARAVDRFESWWTQCVPQTVAGSPTQRMTEGRYLSQPMEHYALDGQPIAQLSRDNLPPLGKFNLVPYSVHVQMANEHRCFDGVACLHAESALLPRRLHTIQQA